jgi:phosphomannomutase
MGDAREALSESRQKNSDALLDALSGQFSMAVTERRQWLTQAVKDPGLIAALEQNDSGALTTAESRLSVLFPDALKTRVLAKGFSGRDVDQVPPIGVAVKEMVQRAENEKAAPGIEVHFPGGQHEQVNFLQPVLTEQGQVVGHLLVTYPANLFHSLFKNYSIPQGFAKLIYTAPDKKEFKLATRGDDALASAPCTQKMAIQNTPLSICLVSTGAGLSDAFSLKTTVMPMVLAAGLLLAFSLLPLMLIRRLLRYDGDVFVSILEDLRANELRHAYSIRISDLQPYLRHLYEIAVDLTEMAALATEQRQNPRRSASGADESGSSAKEGEQDSAARKKSSNDSELPPDILSGIVVKEVPPLSKERASGASQDDRAAQSGQPEQPEPQVSRHRQGGGMEERTPEIPSLFDLDTPDQAEASSPQGDASDSSGLLVEENDEPAVHFPMDFDDSVALAPEIFRAYDIRGVVGRSLNPSVVNLLGKAIGTQALNHGHNAIVVGRDGRLSGPELVAALIDGLSSTGLTVINIGEVPTPMMYFTTFALGTGAGVELTGSHNPKDHNGMKIMLGGETLSGEAIQQLRKLAESRQFAVGNGKVREQNMLSDYLDKITEDITLHRPMKVVIDCGNGVAGAVAPKLFKLLGCSVEPLFAEVNGHFPNHHPDPSDPENLDAMISLVRLQKADIGIAFDGDGDRLGVVDCQGRIIWPDRQMMLFAKDVLSRNPGSDIIYDVKCSNKLAEVITDNAGVPVMWKTGHSLIKAKLKESGAPLAGEMSGHIFFSERWFGFDDALYAAARLLEILSADSRATSEIFGELPDSVSTPELKIPMQEGQPAQFMRTFLAKAKFSDAKITTIDGLRADFMDGWGLIRASNTTACLVLRFDADTSEALDRIQRLFKEQLLAVDPDLMLPF